MSEERATGTILRIYPLTETSLIIHWLTGEHGRIATVAKGALRPKSPFRGKLDLFYHADFSFMRSRRSELHTLREVSLLEMHPALRRDLACLRQVSYCAALLEQVTERETPLPCLAAAFDQLLNHVSRQPPQPSTVFAFELKLLAETGLAPQQLAGSLTPGAAQLVSRLANEDWSVLTNLRMSDSQVTEVRQFLHGFMVYHLGKVPEGRNQALESHV